MKKSLLFAFVVALLLCGTAFAQKGNPNCRENFENAKKTYRERGAQSAQPLFDWIEKHCDESTKKQARSWLRQQAEEQKRKEAEEQKRKERQQAAASGESTNNNLNSISSEDQSFTVNGVRFNMIKVEGGTFLMGATSEQGSDTDSDEKPVHSVTLSDYYIGQTEVTQELWQAVMGSNPSYFKGDSRCPVESVSREDCQKFIEELNRLTGRTFRLPTEAEWEFAARGWRQEPRV